MNGSNILSVSKLPKYKFSVVESEVLNVPEWYFLVCLF